MMKKYEEPILKLVYTNKENIICESLSFGGSESGDGDVIPRITINNTNDGL